MRIYLVATSYAHYIHAALCHVESIVAYGTRRGYAVAQQVEYHHTVEVEAVGQYADGSTVGYYNRSSSQHLAYSAGGTLLDREGHGMEVDREFVVTILGHRELVVVARTAVRNRVAAADFDGLIGALSRIEYKVVFPYPGKKLVEELELRAATVGRR